MNSKHSVPGFHLLEITIAEANAWASQISVGNVEIEQTLAMFAAAPRLLFLILIIPSSKILTSLGPLGTKRTSEFSRCTCIHGNCANQSCRIKPHQAIQTNVLTVMRRVVSWSERNLHWTHVIADIKRRSRRKTCLRVNQSS